MSLFKNQSLTTKNQNPFSVWQSEMNKLFDKFSHDFGDFSLDKFSPKIEVKEGDKNYTIFAEVPGMNEKDINLTLRDNSLIIEGERKSEVKDEKEGYSTSEFSYGSFYRSIPLDQEVNSDTVKASYKNGILTVNLDKTNTESHKSKKISILNQ